MKTSELRLKNIFQESTSINDLIKEGRFQEIEGVCKTIKHFSNSTKTLLFGASDKKTNGSGYSGRYGGYMSDE
jgi:hypothetical protein